MLQKSTVQDICDQVASHYSSISDLVTTINASDPEYFPLVTQDDDYDFELKMNPALTSDVWSVDDLAKASPIKNVCSGLLSYFSQTRSYDQINQIGSLDNYLYANSMTVSENFAKALECSTSHVLSGWVVNPYLSFTFAEFGEDENGTAYFDSIASFQTDDLNAGYGNRNDIIAFAPTLDVVVEIVEATGTINFDIELICKDENGDAFIFEQTLSGIKGDEITLNLSKKITGVSGLQTAYTGSAGDLFRIKTLPSEV